MGRLSNKEFLSQVESHLKKNEGKSSVYLTQKRLNSIDDTQIDSTNTDDKLSSKFDVIDPLSSTKTTEETKDTTAEYPLLLRFTDGTKDLKLSTVVEFKELNKFWDDYSNVLKAGFVGLKKKTKKKAKKSKKSAGKVTK
ncbi:unnamed protein product [Ambrosiozyma monospora]|uniref:Signal recognition particle subunit SRP14 n=1 Tax=Ambrosiozyma monospora TaxID=43982 RepID=A0A9W6YV66_AMBMO|nr:unnamed protein product [Ambrosiozyma monospora]